MKLFKRNSLIIILSTFLIVAISLILSAYSSGISGRTDKDGNIGCNCHGNINSAVNVEIIGPSTVFTNSQNQYTVKITGGPLVRAGVNISSNKGNLANISSDLRLESRELVHTSPKAPSQGSVSFDFNFIAPAQAEDVRIYATGNSVNGNGTSSGDAWNFAPVKNISVLPATNISEVDRIPDKFELYQNYPNPFNPSTNISYSIKNNSWVNLRVFDTQGNHISTLVDKIQAPGKYEINFDGKDLSTGVYYYSLSVDGNIFTKKMLLVK